MIEEYKLVKLIQNYEYYLNRLNSLTGGSIDVRETENKKYIYQHIKEDGKYITKYIGEYSDSLYYQLQSNNAEIKLLNKKIKYLKKYIDEYGPIKKILSEEAKNNLKLINENKNKLIYNFCKYDKLKINEQAIYNIINHIPLNKIEDNDIYADEIFEFEKEYNGIKFMLEQDRVDYKQCSFVLCYINKQFNPENDNYLNDYSLEAINRDIQTILKKDISKVNIAVELLLYIIKRNIFKKYNVTTALIFANMYLITEHTGVMTIPEDLIDRFNNMIENYNNGRDVRILKKFIITKCYIKNPDDLSKEENKKDNYNIKTTKIYNYYREND